MKKKSIVDDFQVSVTDATFKNGKMIFNAKVTFLLTGKQVSFKNVTGKGNKCSPKEALSSLVKCHTDSSFALYKSTLRNGTKEERVAMLTRCDNASKLENLVGDSILEHMVRVLG